MVFEFASSHMARSMLLSKNLFSIEMGKVLLKICWQTGSGKTYTMSGAFDKPKFAANPSGYNSLAVNEDRGMIPRAVEMIFREKVELESRGWTYTIKVSFLEIYNEVLRDLLADPSQDGRNKLEIKQPDANARIASVSNLQVIEVESEAAVQALLERARIARATAATSNNLLSSRSHSVFTMVVKGHHAATQEECEGALNLIDLAGSERLQTGTSALHVGGASNEPGERLRETQSINKSLSSLCDVISALANKEGHVPFRNSKLTYLLQPCLGGDCKTLMFVNCSPSKTHFQETLCSLRFASKVSSVELRRRTSE
mmetsp:Transcript_87685/g.233422  ORF Transcript_87685/g.233422 Transcript_87685/m.233422 type:complete len:315 (-) Transcript_87685:93-1037(-)